MRLIIGLATIAADASASPSNNVRSRERNNVAACELGRGGSSTVGVKNKLAMTSMSTTYWLEFISASISGERTENSLIASPLDSSLEDVFFFWLGLPISGSSYAYMSTTATDDTDALTTVEYSNTIAPGVKIRRNRDPDCARSSALKTSSRTVKESLPLFCSLSHCTPALRSTFVGATCACTCWSDTVTNRRGASVEL